MDPEPEQGLFSFYWAYFCFLMVEEVFIIAPNVYRWIKKVFFGAFSWLQEIGMHFPHLVKYLLGTIISGIEFTFLVKDL